MTIETTAVRVLGRYAVYGRIAAGGMATVHLGRMLGPVGFSRTVAIKRLHETYAKDPEFVSMFLDEARLAARIRHPNVVPTLDVVATEGELFLVMEYVQGESLAGLLRAAARNHEKLPPPHAISILAGALDGLHAAHEARSERGDPLDIVHRDVSPQNILIGVDGIARILDFGVAKAAGRLQTTRDGQLKGKMAYMAPEQLRGGRVDRRTDVWAAGVVLWEALTGKRLFKGDSDVEVFGKILCAEVDPPSEYAPHISPALDQIVSRALSAKIEDRFPTAWAMARELERCVALVPNADVGAWVGRIASQSLSAKADVVARIESGSSEIPVFGSLTPAGGPSVRDVMQAAMTEAVSQTAADSETTQLSTGSISQTHTPQVQTRAHRVWLFAAGASLLAMTVGVAVGFAVRPAKQSSVELDELVTTGSAHVDELPNVGPTPSDTKSAPPVLAAKPPESPPAASSSSPKAARPPVNRAQHPHPTQGTSGSDDVDALKGILDTRH